MFKDHFFAELASANPDYLIIEWDQLLPQTLSAEAYLFGNVSFNKVYLAPPGIKVVEHRKWTAYNCGTFMVHGPGILPRAQNITNVCNIFHQTLIQYWWYFKRIPKEIPFPAVTTKDFWKQATTDTLALLQNWLQWWHIGWHSTIRINPELSSKSTRVEDTNNHHCQNKLYLL